MKIEKKNIKSILLVEDDVYQAQIIKDRLNDFGYRCVTSTSRGDLFTKMGNQEFDLIISDLNIRGSNGGQTLESIIDRMAVLKYECPILVISGFIDLEILKRHSVNIKGAFIKPFNIELLLTKVHSILCG